MSSGSSHRMSGAHTGAHDIAVLVAATVAYVAHGWQPSEWLSALPYAIALATLALMDVELPHGDTVDVDASVVIACVYIFGPMPTLGMVLLARTIAHLLRYARTRTWTLVPALAKRVIGIAAATLALNAVSSVSFGRIQVYVEVFVVGLAYTLASLIYAQISLALTRRDSIVRMTLANLVLQGPVLAAEMSVAILVVLVREGMGIWGLVLVMLLAVMTRQSFVLLLDTRQGYQSTIEALVGAMEAQLVHGSGVGNRVAALARAAGAEYGWFGRSLENMGYAALLVHFGLSFVMRDEETGEVRPTPLAEVEFLRPVAPIVEIAENPQVSAPVQRSVTIAAYIVALSVAHMNPQRAERMVAGLSARLTPKERWRCEDAVARAAQKQAA
ncbi:MAG: hypothetical protein RBS78_05080 [Coriobacteriia bacterium]|jgi:hypothetical protein|nr:hypothetical protein [Coriobacteriia bacterium]